MEFKISHQEKSMLYGLPHLLQLLYVMGIRPYMDYQTGMVGIQRGISYQSLREELYVEPHPGYRGGSPSKAQIQRALIGLEKAGVINLCSQHKKLIIRCLLATRDNFVQNKAATGSIPLSVTKNSLQPTNNAGNSGKNNRKAATEDLPKAATPPVSGNYNTLYLAERAEKIFGDFQPSLKIIEKAQQQNCPTVNCQDELTKFICYHQAKGTLSCDWDAEFLRWLLMGKHYHQEKKHERHQNRNKKQRTSAVGRVVAAHGKFINEGARLIESDEKGHCFIVGEYD